MTSKQSCPQCKKPTVQKYRPFCSKRCADLDLGKWLTEAYVLPGETPADEEELEQLARAMEAQSNAKL